MLMCSSFVHSDRIVDLDEKVKARENEIAALQEKLKYNYYNHYSLLLLVIVFTAVCLPSVFSTTTFSGKRKRS